MEDKEEELKSKRKTIMQTNRKKGEHENSERQTKQ